MSERRPERTGTPCFGAIYRVPSRAGAEMPSAPAPSILMAIAQEFSPRYERHGDDLVSIDLSGLERLLGTWRTIGEELFREAGARAGRVHVAVAGTRTAAVLLACARPGLTVIEPGGERAALAPLPMGILVRSHEAGWGDPAPALDRVARWGIATLGELARLPASDLTARLGRQAIDWQARARGEDRRPLIPELPEERFAASLDLDWPIEGLEPLSFVLTRLLEPLATRLERCDRGAAVLHIVLQLVTRTAPDAGSGGRDIHARRLDLPSPLRDVRALRTLALLDLESHPPQAPIERVTLVIDPTPGRVLQYGLFARRLPTPEQVSTLLARLGALMGQDRIGAPASVDTFRPGAFAMVPFTVDHERSARAIPPAPPSRTPMTSALRRWRHPVPARVIVAGGRPVRVWTDRRALAGGEVRTCAGPWRTSGDWWRRAPREAPGWNRDEWDVALSDGGLYRIFQDRDTDRWFIEALLD